MLQPKSLNNNTTANMLGKQAGWLLGTWQNKTPRGTLVEIWYKQNDSTYAGRSY